MKEKGDGIKTQRGEGEEKTEQFTKWSMGHTTDIVAALSKSRGGRTTEGRKGDSSRVGGVRRGNEMVIGPSRLSLKANNHNHNHTAHLETKCVCACV